MAHHIKAINAFRPRLEYGIPVDKPELLRSSSRATGIVEGTLDLGIKELRDQIIEYCRAGRTVRVDGLGTWSPSIDLNGKFSIIYRPDPAFSYGLNLPGIYKGKIINRENIGKSSRELVDLWNKEHPEDPVPIVIPLIKPE